MEPEFGKPSFRCFHCSIVSQQNWKAIDKSGFSTQAGNVSRGMVGNRQGYVVKATCSNCSFRSLWVQDPLEGDQMGADSFGNINTDTNGRLIFPLVSPVAAPHEDMPAEAAALYSEAASIVNHSPRSAAALLRVCAEEICDFLGAKGTRLFDQIGNLVSEHGLDKRVQRAFDSLRIVGNDSVHSNAEIRLDDDRSKALRLFKLVNLIVKQTITAPREVNELWDELPESKRDGVDQRDSAD